MCNRRVAVHLEDETFQLFSDTLTIHCHWASHRHPRESHQTDAATSIGYWMFLVAHEGGYRGRLADHGPFSAGTDEVVCIPPGTHFALEFAGPGVLSAAAVSIGILGGLDLLDFFTVGPVIAGMDGETIAGALERYTRVAVSMGEWDFASLARFSSSAHALLERLLAAADPRAEANERLRGALRLLPAIAYIRNHIAEHIARADLARLLGVGEQHLHVLFRTYLGVSPYRYIQRVRLSKAQIELARSDETIATIAERLGFCDQFHFSKQFKKSFGVSPASYRERKRRFLADVRG